MEKTITYSSIERVVYKFTESEMKDALMKAWNIDYKKGRKYEFETEENENGKCSAVLTIIYEEQSENVG